MYSKSYLILISLSLFIIHQISYVSAFKVEERYARDSSIIESATKTETSVIHTTTLSVKVDRKVEVKTDVEEKVVTKTEEKKATKTKTNKSVKTVYRDIPNLPMERTANEEGKRILDQLWNDFKYGDINNLFKDNTCKDSLPAVWAIAVTLQAFADGELAYKGYFKDRISQIYDFMNTYYNADKKGYSASNSRDEDLYFDDNAQVGSALVTAYEATGDIKYIQRADEVNVFLRSSWNSKVGGFTWKYKEPYVASISTLEVSLSLFRVYRHNKAPIDLEYAIKGMNWILDNLLDKSSNLIFDGMSENDRKINDWRFTYHVGTALSLCSYLYKETKDNKWKDWTIKFAEASINQDNTFYPEQMRKRYRVWKDQFSFTSLLVEGMADGIKYDILKDKKFTNELAQEARAAFNFGKDSSGSYYSDLSPVNKGKDIGKVYNEWALDNKEFEDKRPKCEYKENTFTFSLIDVAAAARVFFHTAKVIDKLN